MNAGPIYIDGWSVDPDVCASDLSVDVTPLADGRSAVTVRLEDSMVGPSFRP